MYLFGKMNIQLYIIAGYFYFISAENVVVGDIGLLKIKLEDRKSPFAEYFVRRWVTSIAEANGEKLSNTSNSNNLDEEFNISKLIKDINEHLGGNILLKSENNIKVNYANTLKLIKHRGHDVLRNTLRTNDLILLLLSERIFDNYVDQQYFDLEGYVKEKNFSTKIHTRSIRATSTVPSLSAIIRKFLGDVLLVIFKPVQVLLDQSITSAINALMAYYQPIEPPGFFQSIGTSILNRLILLVVDYIDLQRTAINNIFTNSGGKLTKSLSSSVKPGTRRPEMRNIIDVVVRPINFFAAVLFTPVHTIFTIVANIVFSFLRPIFSGTILGQVEGLVRRLINLIPCLQC